MKCILLSFDAVTFEQLENHKIIFEYRNIFPEGEFEVYFYVSKPVMAISGKAYFGSKELLEGWKQKYADRPQEVRERINDFAGECKFVVPIFSFQKTNKLPLKQLRKDIPNFVVPRMYYYVDGNNIGEYIRAHLQPIGAPDINTFEEIPDDFICN